MPTKIYNTEDERLAAVRRNHHLRRERNRERAALIGVTIQGKVCDRCVTTLRSTVTGECVKCRNEYQRQYKRRQFKRGPRINQRRYKPKPLTVDQKASRAAYAREYRRTPKGKLVNQVGQNKTYARRKNAEGSHTTAEWESLKAHYGCHCLCCGTHEDDLRHVLEQDHVIPLSKGGTNWITNIQPLCDDCNNMGGKGTASTDYRPGWNGAVRIP